MKEITRIHLAKTPYEIEINAKKDLEKYLAEIEKNMQADADAMREIEARMVEILAERDVKSDGVVTADDVAAIKQTLGGSEEFAGDEVAPSKRPVGIDGDKKLMRDLDNAWVGGVGSGIAAYFGVDVVIVRVVMLILLLISFGTFLFIYLLLWILIPPAKTAADKLRMRGKPVTLEALRDTSNASDGRTSAGRMISVILRSIVVVMLAFGALGALLATIFGSLYGFAIAAFFGGTDQVWATMFVVALVVGGLALTTTFAILAYGTAALKLTRAARIGVAAALIVGFITIPVIGISVPQLKYSISDDTKEVTMTIPANVLEGTTAVNVEGALSSVFINETDGDEATATIVYREMVYDGAPKVSFERHGEELVIVVSDNYSEACAIHGAVKEFCDHYGIDRVEVRGSVKNLVTDDVYDGRHY